MRIRIPRRPGLAGIITLLAVSLITLPALFHDRAPAPFKRLLNSLVPVAEAAAPHFLNGKIAFESDRTGNREIFVMNPDGTNQVNLSNNPAADGNPAWSFDGTKIAFNSNRDGDAEVYVMNADGTGQTRLTTSAQTDGSPSFSPNGQKIAFQSFRTGSFEIFLMNADGSNQTQLTNAAGNDLNAVFSPDGSKIAFTSNRDGNAEIYIMNADGSNETRLTNNPALDQIPAFSPNGKKIAFQRLIDGTTQIMVMNPDGSNQTQLTSSTSQKFEPFFSGDGNSISFSVATSNNDEIFIMKADGTGQTQLTNSAGRDLAPAWQWLPSPDTIGVYRPSTSQFLLRNSTTAGSPNQTIAFGQVGDLPVAGDWNGDGQDTQGVFRNGQFLLRQPTTIVILFHPPVVVDITILVNFGQAGDLPVVGDWNGDGIDTVGVFRPSTGQWRLTNSLNINNSTPPIDLIFNFGSAGDTPVAGDWDGDGRDSIGTFNAGSWALRNSNSAGAADITVLFGTAPGARPVVGDWNGDGIDTIGVLLPSNVFGATTFGLNNVNANLTGSFDILAAFGADGDLPVSGDWDVKPANTAPNSGVNNPGDGVSDAGQVQTFVTTCSDPDGWHDIATIDFKIARSNGNGQGVPIAIWAQFDENHNLIRLYDPDLQIWREGPPGSNLVLENGYVQLNLAGTTVQGSGPTGSSVQVKWEVVFKSTATGKNYKQYLQITDDAGASTAFDNVGSWSVLR